MTNAIKLYKNTDTDKRIGINWSTGNPAYNLDVNGSANISGTLQADNVKNFYQAAGGSSEATSVSADTITQIQLVSTNTIPSSSTNYSIVDGGIKVATAGIYRISASVYLTGGASSGVNRKDVFVRKGTNFSSATEAVSITDNVGTTTTAQHGSVGTTPKLVSASANDIFYLACRLRGGSGSYYGNNAGTWLLVEKVG